MEKKVANNEHLCTQIASQLRMFTLGDATVNGATLMALENFPVFPVGGAIASRSYRLC